MPFKNELSHVMGPTISLTLIIATLIYLSIPTVSISLNFAIYGFKITSLEYYIAKNILDVLIGVIMVTLLTDSTYSN